MQYVQLRLHSPTQASGQVLIGVSMDRDLLDQPLEMKMCILIQFRLWSPASPPPITRRTHRRLDRRIHEHFLQLVGPKALLGSVTA